MGDAGGWRGMGQTSPGTRADVSPWDARLACIRNQECHATPPGACYDVWQLALVPTGTVSCGGDDPCHVVFDASGSAVYVDA